MNVRGGRIFFLVIALLGGGRGWCAVAPPDAARIDAIAAYLPATPGTDKTRCSNRAAWDALAARPEARTHIKAAEAVLNAPIPDCSDELYLEFSRNGNRTRYQTPYFKRVFNLDALVLAECLENRGRFRDKIVAYVDAICGERAWTLPAHDGRLLNFNGKICAIDLGAGARALHLALTCDWLRDVLPVATKARIFATCDRRVFQPYLATCRTPTPETMRRLNHWWYDVESNWNSVCHACSVRAALALVPDRRVRAEFVESAERTTPAALRGYTDDGYCSEGMGYWNYGYGHHLQMGLDVRAATNGRVDLFRDPKNRAIMRYPYGYQLQTGRSPYFADGGGGPDGVMLALGRQVFPDLVNRLAATRPLLAGGLPVVALRAFGQDPGPAYANGLDELPIRTWFPAAQVLIARRRSTADVPPLAVAIKGGHNAELHNHNDLGSYVVMLDGVEMAGDPGGEEYTRRTFSKDRYVSKMLNSYGHPVPVVGGKLQMTGRAAAATVLETAFTETNDVLRLDCTAAYLVKTLTSLVRTLTFDRVSARLTITDAVVFSEPTTFEVPVVTYRAFTHDAAAAVFRLGTDGAPSRQLAMDVVASEPVSFRAETIDNAPRRPVHRLAFTFVRPVRAATFTTVYSPVVRRR